MIHYDEFTKMSRSILIFIYIFVKGYMFRLIHGHGLLSYKY